VNGDESINVEFLRCFVLCCFVVVQVGTLQLEWEYLSRHTGDPKYAELVRRPMEVLHRAQPASGLFPMYLDPKTGNVQGNTITLGARVDSLYECVCGRWHGACVSQRDVCASVCVGVHRCRWLQVLFEAALVVC